MSGITFGKPQKNKAGGATNAHLPFELQCPCCYSPGKALCATCTPEDSAQKLAALRNLMVRDGVDAIIIPSEDQHCSEYVAPCDEYRSFLTGFCGSAGVAVVTKDEALCWTDSRYFIQAESQLEAGWTLMKQYEPGVPTTDEWITANVKGKVGIDAYVTRASSAKKWREELNWQVQPLKTNLIQELWGEGRPAVPANAITPHPMHLSGESVAAKLGRTRAELTRSGAGALVLSALDQIAWLYNLRGSDIQCNPVFFAYSVVTATAAVLWVRGSVPNLAAVRAHLGSQAESGVCQGGAGGGAGGAAVDVEVRCYEDFCSELPAVVGAGPGPRKAMVEKSCSVAVVDALMQATGTGSTAGAGAAAGAGAGAGAGAAVPTTAIELIWVDESPVEHFKSRKNAAEAAGVRESQLREAVAIVGYFAWLEDRLRNPVAGAAPLNEASAAAELSRRRLAQEGCVGGAPFPFPFPCPSLQPLTPPPLPGALGTPSRRSPGAYLPTHSFYCILYI
jgi:Xaa-Pro aminopeptidase